MLTVVAQLNVFQILSRLEQESSFPEESINKHSKEFLAYFIRQIFCEMVLCIVIKTGIFTRILC